MKKAIIFAALVIVLLTPSLVFAQGILEGPLVAKECIGPICQFCDLVNLLQRVLNFAVAFTVVVATLMFAYAGILYVTAAANPKNIQKAHSIFGHVFVGFLLVLTAWLIINIILSVLTGRGLTSWTKDIDCPKQPTYQQAPTGQPPGAVTPTKPTSDQIGQVCGATVCVGLQIPTQSSTCAKAADGTSCLVTVATNLSVVGMAEDLNNKGLTMTATAAIGGTHKAPCQNAGNSKSGTCIDAVVAPFVNPTGKVILDAATIRTVIDAGRAHGLRAEYEVSSQTVAALIRAQAAERNIFLGTRDILVVPEITGPHFSVYLSSVNPAPF